MPSIKPSNYVKSSKYLKNIESLIRINPKQFEDDLKSVNAAITLVNMSKRKRNRSRGKTVKKRKPKRKKSRRSRK
jgi:hypothetical protein